MLRKQLEKLSRKVWHVTLDMLPSATKDQAESGIHSCGNDLRCGLLSQEVVQALLGALGAALCLGPLQPGLHQRRLLCGVS